jgi:hypothetical protein
MSNVLEMALEALKAYQKAGFGNSTDMIRQREAYGMATEAIAALQEAIKQQEQKHAEDD